ncbi:DUF1656 domain-containing protein [Hyphomicrobium facile]|uniref:DUF1656 domain-containing protein n=1 Tax=Hyphomicrobium facile TaxID=51670 RepID=A0A1I7NR51_9HYPH|nr:DUF1656 domain-containing protein [Hyphomicrobium facile]SFV37072.1 Protein of unknown function [Hyphomicrobium facile]
MTPVFNEVVIGGIMLAPIITSVGMTIVTVLALRPVLRRIGFTRLFASSAIAEFSLYVTIFSLFTLFA